MTREEQINTIKAIIQECEDYEWQRKEALFEIIKELEQEPKTGHWIYSKVVNTGEITWSECSVCGNGELACAKRMKYCPKCGAKLESEVT